MIEIVGCVMVSIQNIKKLFYLTLSCYIKLHFLPSISQNNFSGTRFTKKKITNENIGQLGAGEELGAWGSL